MHDIGISEILKEQQQSNFTNKIFSPWQHEKDLKKLNNNNNNNDNNNNNNNNNNNILVKTVSFT